MHMVLINVLLLAHVSVPSPAVTTDHALVGHAPPDEPSTGRPGRRGIGSGVTDQRVGGPPAEPFRS